ncbi:MAG: phytanoyl-CoA dioxygenase family protein [Candidatus Latescibacteria bacterium]|nr:phytanoyl-CoA dioxygenase family protein [Candidatus Latescibacterota bacterium]
MTDDGAGFLPGLEEAYDLTIDQINDFRELGFIHLPGVLSTREVEVYREVIHEAAHAHFGEVVAMADRPADDFSRVFLQAFNLRETDPRAARFILARRFGKIVAELMGVDGVRIYYDKPMFKEPDSRITPWHQDGPHWPLYGDNVLTLWIPLVDITNDMGPLSFAARTHRKKGFGPRGIHDDSQQYYERYIDEHAIEVFKPSLKAGEASLHNHWVLHSAGRNTTNRMREVMGITYYEDGMHIDDSACDETARPVIDETLGSRKPGERADSNRNQVVYRTSPDRELSN